MASGVLNPGGSPLSSPLLSSSLSRTNSHAVALVSATSAATCSARTDMIHVPRGGGNRGSSSRFNKRIIDRMYACAEERMEVIPDVENMRSAAHAKKYMFLHLRQESQTSADNGGSATQLENGGDSDNSDGAVEPRGDGDDKEEDDGGHLDSYSSDDDRDEDEEFGGVLDLRRSDYEDEEEDDEDEAFGGVLGLCGSDFEGGGRGLTFIVVSLNSRGLSRLRLLACSRKADTSNLGAPPQ